VHSLVESVTVWNEVVADRRCHVVKEKALTARE
jgi:hypothetical protein